MFSTPTFDNYLLRALALACGLVIVTLAAVMMLTQSLRFLELIITSGASSVSFLTLTLLALPRLFEIIFPIGIAAGLLFIYNRMSIDNELVVAQAAGWSAVRLARPGLILAAVLSFVMFVVMSWLAPISLAHMQSLRNEIKAQYSSLMFREGVFNTVGPDVTVYVGKRESGGNIEAVLIHDQRPENPRPVTVLARKGVIVSTDTGNQVIVYDGSRQTFNEENGVLERLHFDRYTIDLPESGAIKQRFREPEERTLPELLRTDFATLEHDRMRRDFRAEIHKRFISSLLPITFAIMSLCVLLLGSFSRRGQGRKALAAMVAVMTLQGLYLASFNLAQKGIAGIFLMYILILAPVFLGAFMLRAGRFDIWRRAA